MNSSDRQLCDCVQNNLLFLNLIFILLAIILQSYSPASFLIYGDVAALFSTEGKATWDQSHFKSLIQNWKLMENIKLTTQTVHFKLPTDFLQLYFLAQCWPILYCSVSWDTRNGFIKWMQSMQSWDLACSLDLVSPLKIKLSSALRSLGNENN